MREPLLEPWRKAFLAQRALPGSVLGPVECRHGAKRRMSSAWRTRRSGDQPDWLRRASLAPEGDKFREPSRKPLTRLRDFRLQQFVCSDFFRLGQALDASMDLAKRPEARRGAPIELEVIMFASISAAPEPVRRLQYRKIPLCIGKL
jgi:hypothetical protein